MALWLSLLTIFLLTSCASTPHHTRRSQAPQTPKRREVAQEIKIVPAPKKPKIVIKSLPDVMNAYDPEISDLASADDRKIASLKEDLSKYLPPQAKKLSLLANPDTKGAWFGSILIAVNENGRAYFIDKSGKFYTEDLKDRVIGGTFKNSRGETELFTVFFSGLISSQQYRAYVGAEPAKVLEMDLDHEHAGSMKGKLRTASGETLSVERPGRNNKAVRVNGQQINALFL